MLIWPINQVWQNILKKIKRNAIKKYPTFITRMKYNFILQTILVSLTFIACLTFKIHFWRLEIIYFIYFTSPIQKSCSCSLKRQTKIFFNLFIQLIEICLEIHENKFYSMAGIKQNMILNCIHKKYSDKKLVLLPCGMWFEICCGAGLDCIGKPAIIYGLPPSLGPKPRCT